MTWRESFLSEGEKNASLSGETSNLQCFFLTISNLQFNIPTTVVLVLFRRLSKLKRPIPSFIPEKFKYIELFILYDFFSFLILKKYIKNKLIDIFAFCQFLTVLKNYELSVKDFGMKIRTCNFGKRKKFLTNFSLIKHVF